MLFSLLRYVGLFIMTNSRNMKCEFSSSVIHVTCEYSWRFTLWSLLVHILILAWHLLPVSMSYRLRPHKETSGNKISFESRPKKQMTIQVDFHMPVPSLPSFRTCFESLGRITPRVDPTWKVATTRSGSQNSNFFPRTNLPTSSKPFQSRYTTHQETVIRES